MPKIDITKIEGYETMTPEQKLKALEDYEYDDASEELERTKAALSKANSEAAENKRKLKEKLTTDEQKAQAEIEERETLKKTNAELLEKLTVAENMRNLISLGYDENLATDTAKAMFAGDRDRIFANQQKHQAEMRKQIEAEMLKKTPAPPAGAGSQPVDYGKKIEEAQASGDYSTVAYYTRLKAEQEAQATT